MTGATPFKRKMVGDASIAAQPAQDRSFMQLFDNVCPLHIMLGKKKE
jgi:hypothetical protein